MISTAKNNGSFSYLILSRNQLEGNLKDYAISIKNKLNGGFVFVVNQNGEKLSMVAAAGEKALSSGIRCGEIIAKACVLANGKGGGRPDLAQGGGSNADPAVITAEVEKLILN